MFLLFHYRFLTALSAIFITGMMAWGFYLEHILGLEPCPLCMMQRVVFVALAVVFFIAALVNPGPGKGRVVFSTFSVVIAGAGMALAGRQLYLQSLTAEEAGNLSCGMGLEFMLDAFPFWEVVRMSLMGTGDCAEIQWVFLGLTIPGWTFVAFGGFAILSLWLVFMHRFHSWSGT